MWNALCCFFFKDKSIFLLHGDDQLRSGFVRTCHAIMLAIELWPEVASHKANEPVVINDSANAYHFTFDASKLATSSSFCAQFFFIGICDAPCKRSDERSLVYERVFKEPTAFRDEIAWDFSLGCTLRATQFQLHCLLWKIPLTLFV